MANVFLCVLRGIGGFSKLQVVKRLRPEFAEEPDFRDMFLEEARLAARINHVNVVQTNEVGIDGNNLFIAMEYLEGQSLEELIRRAAKVGRPLALKYFLPILVDTLRGLHFAHELKDFQGRPLNVIHRDVSPHNIFVTYDGQVKVVDFGIAKAADSSHETNTGVLKGKVAYMAPEQVVDKRRVDRRADVFSVGTILWRALTGKRLWRGMNDMEILVKITQGEIPLPTDEKPNLDPAIVAICMKAVALSADARYQSAREMLEALEGYMTKAGDRASSHEIGSLVTELFADRRNEIAAAIEKRTSEADASVQGWSDIDMAAPVSSRNTLTPSHISASLHSKPIDIIIGAPVLASADSEATVAAVSPEQDEVKRRSKLPIALAAAALLVGGVVGITALIHKSSATSGIGTTSTASSAVAPATPSSAVPPRDQVQFQIKLDPADAAVAIDDQPLTPSSHYSRDGSVHRVRVTAAGYEPEVTLITFESPTVTLDVTLHKKAERLVGALVPVGRPTRKHPQEPEIVSAAPPPQPPPPVTPPPPATTAKPAPTDTNKLGIDTSNPWGK